MRTHVLKINRYCIILWEKAKIYCSNLEMHIELINDFQVLKARESHNSNLNFSKLG